MKRKKKVFISYTVRDNLVDEHFLNELNELLNKSFYVFIDYLHNDSINKQDRIEKEITSSDILFLIITKQIFYSEWVLQEIEIAKKMNIPIYEFEFCELRDKKFLPIIDFKYKENSI
jgi:TIR domain.